MRISVLGDSVSTFSYISNNVVSSNMDYYYPCPNGIGNDITGTASNSNINKFKMWWFKVCDAKNAELWMVDAIGSTRVAWYDYEPDSDSDHIGQSWCMDNQNRINDLKRNNIDPDYILFAGGLNDIVVPDNYFDINRFHYCYDDACNRMHNTYPNAKIVCITPFSTYLFVYGHEQRFAQICYVIYATVCARSSYCYFANLQGLELGTGKVDINCHPNSVGMNEIANIVKNSF